MFPASLDIIHSFPGVKQLAAGDFDLERLVERLTEALGDDSQRNEIQRLTGDTAVLVVECLDKVSEVNNAPVAVYLSRSRSYRPTPLEPGQISKHVRGYSPRSRDSLADVNTSPTLTGSTQAR